MTPIFLLWGDLADPNATLAGNDYLHGGTGNDWLLGGAGSDTYVFNLGDGVDVILENTADATNTETNVTYRWLTQCIRRQHGLLQRAA